MDIIYCHNTPYHNTLNTHWSYFLLLTGCWRYSGHCLHLMWMISTFYNFYISPHGCNALSHIKDVFCLNVMCTAVLHVYCNKDVLNAVSAHDKQATPLLAKFRKLQNVQCQHFMHSLRLLFPGSIARCSSTDT